MDCPFLKDAKLSRFNIQEFQYEENDFLVLQKKYKEFFFIIDNTDFPLFSDVYGDSSSTFVADKRILNYEDVAQLK